jgi:hypothetical protein
MKNIAQLSEHIDGMAAAKRQAEQQLDAAIGTLRVVHMQLLKASGHVQALTGDDQGRGALSELAEYTVVGRALVAEAVLALARLRPGTGPGKDENGKALVEDARRGMQAKRLAKWEAEALREAVVAVLGGEDGT